MDATPADATWPAEDLEHLGACPVCASTHRAILFDALTDLSYGVAPGSWQLWQCGGCTAAYLDPRPSEASIGRAYGRYYTHEHSDPATLEGLITGTSLKTRLRTGYYNHAFGHLLPHGAPFAGLLAALLPNQARVWADFIRHVPPPSKQGAPLLDVGCGSGVFLVLARALGYTPTGLEPDPEAARTARAAGIAVRAGALPDSGLAPGTFEQITVSHVFEHLHRPREAIAELFHLLRPGGRLWITQPNLGSAGRDLFGEHWRGLEAPRHLILFDAAAFIRFLQQAGFADVRLLPPPRCAADYFKSSLSMQEGQTPGPGVVPRAWNAAWAKQARAADQQSVRAPERGESITVVATRPAT